MSSRQHAALWRMDRLKTLFLDESGDHNLDVIDPEYPIFVLGGVVMDADYAAGALVDELADFKRTLFGHSNIALRTADIARNRNGFEPLLNRGARARFYQQLNRLMRNLEYSVMACIIDKRQYRSLYGAFAPDPYLTAFTTLVEKYCRNALLPGECGTIIAEGRDPVLDRLLLAEWNRLRDGGTANDPTHIDANRVQNLYLRRKTDNVAGLEIADLVISPIGRNHIGKSRYEDWRIVAEKLLRDNNGAYLGCGLTVLP